jgi:hypothetical protein
MKYDKKKFDDSVAYYQKRFKGKVENKLMMVLLDLNNKNAFFSIAPLSMAVHELNGEMHVIVKNSEPKNFLIMKKAWGVYEDLVGGVNSKEARALRDFIGCVDKRTKKNEFRNIFRKPDLFLQAGEKYFVGDLVVDFKSQWHKPYRFNDLLATARRLVKEGYDLRKNERFGISFELVAKKSDMGLPLEDYLDSYSIALAMALEAVKSGARVGLGASTVKFSMLAPGVRTIDLMSTLTGCELDKNVKEGVFQKFKALSPLIGADNMEFNDASFGIHGKGYSGKLFFGENIGYPTLNKKSRWLSPGQMMLKDRYETQTKFESRPPMMRYAMTETLPIDIFIETCNVDYSIIRKRSEKIKKILDKCDKVMVIGQKIKGLQTNFVVDLIDKSRKVRREFIASDSDVTSKIDKDYLKATGIKSGNYANFPSGEAFVTPEKLEGTVVGDVVVNVDQSYRLSAKEPLVLKVHNYEYKVIKGPKKLIAKMNHEKKEVMKKIGLMEKSKALPQSMIDMYKKCFNYIGEFAVNLNPKAKVCDYLIVNEKIAKMMHVAMGMGFEPDRKTLYHWDMVIDAPRQKMDVYGIDSKGHEHWIIKKGDFVV